MTKTGSKKIKFDPRGFCPVGAFENLSRPLQLLTEAQLDELAEGTKLTCIDGNTVVVGKDYIDRDTRGGFIAFGFLKEEK